MRNYILFVYCWEKKYRKDELEIKEIGFFEGVGGKW